MAKALAKRYARALLELTPPGELEGLRDSLKELSAMWRGDAGFRSAIYNPAYSVQDRIASVLDIAAKVRPGDAKFSNFLALSVQNGRMRLLPEVSDAFTEMVDELKKLLALEVTSAFEVGGDERANLGAAVQKEFGSLASIEWRVSKDLIGGLVIKSGDKLLDTSVRGALNRIKSQLTA